MSGASLRRLIHAATAAVTLLAPLVSPTALRATVVAIAVAALAVDLARASLPRFDGWLQTRLPVFRPHETGHLSGATWLWVGYAVAAWLPVRAAVPAMLVGAWADPAASFVGERIGPPGRKTWAGTGTMWLVSSGILLTSGLGWGTALLGGVLGALVERWPGRLDDNLLVAPVVAAAIAVSA